MDKVRKTLQHISTAETVLLIQDLVQTPSYNPPGNEAMMCEIVKNWLSLAGVEVFTQAVIEDRSNVIAKLRGDGSREALLLCTHLDTVPPGARSWLYDPLSAEIVDGCVYGRGSMDAKGSLAAMMVAMKALRVSGVSLRGDLILLATVDEEGKNLGAIRFQELGGMRGVGGVIIGEATSLDLAIAHRGILALEITTHGKAAHSSMPEKGANAILPMCAILEAISHLSLEEIDHPLLPPSTMNIAKIQGGLKQNMVPDLCQAIIDIRTLPGQSHQQILAKIRESVEALVDCVSGLSVEVHIVDDSPALVTDSNESLVRVALGVAQRQFSRQPIVRGAAYFTDGAILARAGRTPTLVFGPGDEGLAHQADECIEINQVVNAARFYASLAIEVLSDAA